MGGSISGGNFTGRNSPGRVWLVGIFGLAIFWVRVFLIPSWISVVCVCCYDWDKLWLLLILLKILLIMLFFKISCCSKKCCFLKFLNFLSEDLICLKAVSCLEVFCKKGVLRNFAKFIGKRLRQVTLLKKRLWHKCFPVNFMKFLRTPFL